MSLFETVFITVGTTEFDEMLEALDTPQFFEFLVQVRCLSVTFQIGRGEYIPNRLQEIAASRQYASDFVRVFRYVSLCPL